MATSAIGPGFLTQTTVYTNLLLHNFGFVIICSIIIDVIAQITIWRVLTFSSLRGQDLGNKIFPFLGTVLSIMVVFGGIIFNTGNLAGTGLGLNAIFNIDTTWGAIISSIVVVLIFLRKNSLNILDIIIRVLAIIMILIIVILVIKSNVDFLSLLKGSFWPSKVDLKATVTLVGGTVGGYITFAGAHRLIDAGVVGEGNLPLVTKSAFIGIIITGLLRYLLFWGTLGVVLTGVSLSKDNPTGDVFLSSFGSSGLIIFGIIIWAASISSVIGATYTSLSFLKTLNTIINKYERLFALLILFISLSIIVVVGKPVKLLILAGYINGFILPFGLGMVLLSFKIMNIKKAIPKTLRILAWCIVIVMSCFAIISLF